MMLFPLPEGNLFVGAGIIPLMELSNDIRGAAKTAAIEATDDTDVLDEILEERARELAFEGHRWFDLRRNGQPRMERSYRGETYVLEQGDARYTMRIPAEAITANPGLAD